jgi:BirA family biotin operon repressor/biotin-[acetyl-CoA-carboxylase] ligase
MRDEMLETDGRETDSRLGRALVALLESQSGAGMLSGREWAAAAGVSTGEAWKLAEELRQLGVDVEGEAATGWRLVGEADLALPEVLEPKIAKTIFAGGVRHFARIGSTNAAAMRAGVVADDDQQQDQDQGPLQGHQLLHPSKRGLDGVPAWDEALAPHAAPGGAVWLAEEQTAGRGRGGHAWKSNPRDGIYCSALIRPKLAPAEVIILSLAAGLAVVEAVHEVTGLWGDLRWPNDVLLGGRKFCGILTELSAEVMRVRYVVVGVGMNVNHTEFAPELAGIATSLRMETGQRFSRVELVAALLRALDREQAALSGGAGAARERILRRFEEHSSYCCGCAVTVEEDGGYAGVTRGLDERGFLRVESAQGMRTVLSGGVRKR